MTAYDIINKRYSAGELSQHEFYQLIRDFQYSYLIDINYEERVFLHRRPNELKYEILRELWDLLTKIQSRDELRNHDPVKNSHGHVHSEIVEIWRSDKRLKSLFNSTKRFCVLYSRDFHITAVHIAEYRALNKVAAKIQRSIHQSNASAVTKSESPKSTKIKRATIPYKIKVALLKEVNNECPFCGFDEVGHLEAHHIDEDPSHKYPEKLIMVCGNCHSKIGSNEITQEMVEAKKQELLARKK